MEINKGTPVIRNLRGVSEEEAQDIERQVVAQISATPQDDVIPVIIQNSRDADMFTAENDAAQASIHSSIASSLMGTISTDDPTLLPIVDVGDIMIGTIIISSILANKMGVKMEGDQIKLAIYVVAQSCRMYHQNVASEEVKAIMSSNALELMEGRQLAPESLIMHLSELASLLSECPLELDDVYHITNVMVNPAMFAIRYDNDDPDHVVGMTEIISIRNIMRGGLIVCSGIPFKNPIL